MEESEILQLLKEDCHAISSIAKLTGITKQTFYLWIKKNKIPRAKLLFVENAVNEYVRRKKWL